MLWKNCNVSIDLWIYRRKIVSGYCLCDGKIMSLIIGQRILKALKRTFSIQQWKEWRDRNLSSLFFQSLIINDRAQSLIIGWEIRWSLTRTVFHVRLEQILRRNSSFISLVLLCSRRCLSRSCFHGACKSSWHLRTSWYRTEEIH